MIAWYYPTNEMNDLALSSVPFKHSSAKPPWRKGVGKCAMRREFHTKVEVGQRGVLGITDQI